MTTVTVTPTEVTLVTPSGKLTLTTPEEVAALDIPTAAAIAQVFCHEQQQLLSDTTASYHHTRSLLRRLFR